ncbi:hypothetical protein SLE2022_223450 [Rubroshorea leprosula]
MAGESPSNSRNAGDSYIGSFITLISKYEIRYEGVLYCLNVQDSTIGLKNVRSFGTEGRKKDGPQIPPSDKVYEYILFRGSDIKDLQVKSSPPAQTNEQIHNDPAIIQSQYAGLPCNSSPIPSVGGRTLTESNQWQDTPVLSSRAYPSALPAHQSPSQSGPSNHSQTAQNAGGPSMPTSFFWQGYNGAPTSVSNAASNPISLQSPLNLSPPMPVQNHLQAHQLQTMPTGLINTSEPVISVPTSVVVSSSYPLFAHSLTPVQSSSPPDIPSSSSIKVSSPSHAAYMNMTANKLTMPSFPSSYQETNPTEAETVSKAAVDHVADPKSIHPAQPMPYHQPFVSSASNPLLTRPPSLVTPNQLAQTRPHVLSSTQLNYPDQEDVDPGSAVPSYIPPANSTPVTQPPLLPLPVSKQHSQYSTREFTEEFDFEAMNEKFKKDEVWGYLGKGKQRDRTEDFEDNAHEQTLWDKEGHGQSSNFDPKPAYKKDDFFDSISCNSLSHGGWNGQNHFTERMKQDTETFGNFQQRPRPSYGPYGGYGAGRGDNFRGSYNWGRGYGYGGRGRGGNMHF